MLTSFSDKELSSLPILYINCQRQFHCYTIIHKTQQYFSKLFIINPKSRYKTKYNDQSLFLAYHSEAMLNSNDLFTQIGFIVESPERLNHHSPKIDKEQNQNVNQSHLMSANSSSPQSKQNRVHSNKSKAASTSLQIQLGENEVHIVHICASDNAKSLAEHFCKMHRLNQFAVEVMARKIQEAQAKQFGTQDYSINCISPEKDTTKLFHHISPKSKLQKQNKPTNKFREKTQKSNSKPKPSQTLSKKSAKKSVSPLTNKNYKKGQGKQVVMNLTSQAACQRLYNQSVIQGKQIEQKRSKALQERQQKQLEQLTFHPKINVVSQKIVEFRKQTGTQRSLGLNFTGRGTEKVTDNFYQELRQCTFVPEINQVSKMIVQSRQNYQNDEIDHFNNLFKGEKNESLVSSSQSTRRNSSRINFVPQNQPKNKKSRIFLLAQEKEAQKGMFRPKINKKSSQMVKSSFQDRLQKHIKDRENNRKIQDQCTFQPKIGRSPYQFSKTNKQNIPIWEELYSESKHRKKHTPKHVSRKNQISAASIGGQNSTIDYSVDDEQIQKAKASSNLYYENLIQKRIHNVFQVLDSDHDGEISPDSVDIEALSKNCLIFLRPVLEEMDELDVQLNYNDFKRAVIQLLNDCDPHKKGLFLSEGCKESVEQHSFQPKINSKSKELAYHRNTDNVHQQLYEKGLRDRQIKERNALREKSMREENQMRQCSFKPALTVTCPKQSEISQFTGGQSQNFSFDPQSAIGRGKLKGIRRGSPFKWPEGSNLVGFNEGSYFSED